MFICHSTGGIVLKEALTHSEREISRQIKSACLLITFLATPHHGSSVLSDTRCMTQLKDTLGLANVVGGRFLNQMRPFNDFLEDLNQVFLFHCLGIYLWTYGEQQDTLLPEDIWRKTSPIQPGDQLFTTEPEFFVVDNVSSKINNREHNVVADEEEWDPLNTDHMGTARLAYSKREADRFIRWLKEELHKDKVQEWRNHRRLVEEIVRSVNIERHIFDPVAFDGKTTVRIKSEAASLQAFIEPGRFCNERVKASPIGITQRIVKDYERGNTTDVHFVFERGLSLDEERHSPKGMTKSASEHLLDRRRVKKLMKAPPVLTKAVSMPDDIQTPIEPPTPDEYAPSSAHPSSILPGPGISRSPERLSVDEPIEIPEQASLQTPRLGFALPQLNARGASEHYRPFQWLHIPHSVPSWVPLVMSVLSSTRSTKLHGELLTEDLWRQHHNSPTHDAAHGRFVSPHFQTLLTRRASTRDGLPTNASVTGQPQFALYFPYL